MAVLTDLSQGASTGNECVVVILAYLVHLNRQLVSAPFVIGIEKRDVVTPGFLDATVGGPTDSHILPQSEHLDPRIRYRARNSCSTVLTPVVDNENFQILVVLSQSRCYGALDK